MNCLAEATKRLRTEILALRSDRENLQRALREQTMGRRVSTSARCTEFNRDRMAMGKRMAEQRQAFMKNLRQTVGGQQQAVRNDVLAARRAWIGKADTAWRSAVA